MTAVWTAVVPLRLGGSSKSRLAPSLSIGQRTALTSAMAARLAHNLEQVPQIVRRLVLSAADPAIAGLDWADDGGAELNAALASLRASLGGEHMVIIHADLPFVTPDDIAALLAAAERSGAAIAPDRIGTGTNALALARAEVERFAFGQGSYARHLRLVRPLPALVQRDGLAFDLDTPEDLAEAGSRASWPAEWSSLSRMRE